MYWLPVQRRLFDKLRNFFRLQVLSSEYTGNISSVCVRIDSIDGRRHRRSTAFGDLVVLAAIKRTACGDLVVLAAIRTAQLRRLQSVSRRCRLEIL